MATDITSDVLAEIMTETGEDEQTVRDMWDAFQCCADEATMEEDE